MAQIGSSNVSMDAIKSELTTGGGSVSNDLLSFFTSGAKINPFSKHKPVRLNTNFAQDINSSNPNYDADWWGATDGNCGFTPKQVTSYSTLMSVLDSSDEMNGWTYNLPTGTSALPYRLGDFAKYAPDAKPMSYDLVCPEKVENKQNSKLDALCYGAVVNDSSIAWGDFATLKNYFFGIYVKQVNGTQTRRVIGTTPISSGGLTAEISTYGMPTGTWKVYPFIAQVSLGQNDAEVANNWYTIPMVKPRTVEVVSSFITITANASKISGQTKISYSISVVNPLSTSITFASNNFVRCRFANKGFFDAMVAGEQQINLSNNLIAQANSTTIIASGTFSGISSEVYADPLVWYSLNTAAYYGSVVPLSEKV